MSGQLDHQPAEIVSQLLIDLGHGATVASGSAWPVYQLNLPDTPDNVIAVSDTDGRLQGRVHPTGHTEQKYGIQIRIRAQTIPLGRNKGNAIALALDEDVYRDTVIIDSDTYLVQAIHKTSQLLFLGPEPTSRRFLWSLNAIASISLETLGTGTG